MITKNEYDINIQRRDVNPEETANKEEPSVINENQKENVEVNENQSEPVKQKEEPKKQPVNQNPQPI